MARPISAIILDFDGTIVDTEWSEYTTIRDEFRRHGHDYSLDSHRTGVGRMDNRHWSELLVEMTGPLPDLDSVRDRRQRAHHELIVASGVRAGIHDLLDRAERAATALAVASSSPLAWVDSHLQRLDLRRRFQAVATGDQVDRGKPWPDVFLEAARRLDVEPARCLAVEDSHNGVTAAKAAGMVCVAVPNPVTEASDLSGADLVIDSLTDLPWADFDLL